MHSENWEIFSSIPHKSQVAILRSVGRGAQAEVFEGVFSGKQCAVKKYFFTNLNEVGLDFFLREAAILRKLQGCPNIIHCYGIILEPKDHDNGFDLSLVLDWIDAGTLRRFCSKHSGGVVGGTITEQLALSILCDVAGGLVRCHEAGVAHLDIKVKPNHCVLSRL